MLETVLCFIACLAIADSPYPAGKAAKLRAELTSQEQALTKEIAANPRNVRFHSERGDARFFLGRFTEAVEDYDAMVRIDPKTEQSHWRRGIALYYAGDFAKSAKQFETYHEYDDVDRENGIWRYLAQSRALGHAKARAGLLQYTQDDRPPLPDLYAMFAGEITAAEVIERIANAEISDAERNKRRFYADLYIGLDAAGKGDRKEALKYLGKAVANPWGQAASGGPGYMWQVARVNWNVLNEDVGKEKVDLKTRSTKPITLRGIFKGPGKEADYIQNEHGQTFKIKLGTIRDATFPGGLDYGDEVIASGILRLRPGRLSNEDSIPSLAELYYLEKAIVRFADVPEISK